jgi:hypothetical protein
MIITQSSLQMASSHLSQQSHSISQSLRMWTGQPAGSNQVPPAVRGNVNISDAGQAALAADASGKIQDDSINKDPELNLIRDMLEFLTGEKIRVFDQAELETSHQHSVVQSEELTGNGQSTSAGYGAELNYHESYSETEETRFSASGKVITADGDAIEFKIEFSMSRSYQEESNINLRLGDAARPIDPLVLNFSGTPAQLSNHRFAFDLNSDGQDEKINFTAPGSGFLVFDRNKDGKINNGQELFGPSSADGFGELSVLDDDQNGWIDEKDKKFNELGIWAKTPEATDKILTLKEAGVGAIALQTQLTPFSIKNNDNQLLGSVRNSGIFLHESGEAGTIQQIDLTA